MLQARSRSSPLDFLPKGHILKPEVNRTISRFVAFFFLCSASIDMAHPCAEKLEAVGLFPDHFTFNPSGSSDGRTAVPGCDFSREADPGGRESDGHPADDDCFCCNGRALLRSASYDFKPSVWAAVLTPATPSPGLVGLLRRGDFHPPPRFGCLLRYLRDSSLVPFQRSEEILSAGLLSPPGCPAMFDL